MKDFFILAVFLGSDSSSQFLCLGYPFLLHIVHDGVDSFR